MVLLMLLWDIFLTICVQINLKIFLSFVHSPIADAKPFDNLRIVGSVPSRWRSCYSYNHSFGMSENYFIILEQNLCIDLFKAAFAKILGIPYAECMKIFETEEVSVTFFYLKNLGRPKDLIGSLANIFRSDQMSQYQFRKKKL